MPNLRPVPDTPPRAVAYIRVSQEREDMISPELQETAIRDHCARNGYQLMEIITDLDLSGRFWKRRQVEHAIELIERREVEVIVVWKMSRVARNRLDWNIALDRVETVGGRLESATEPIDTSTSSGRFSRGILAELAAFESERAGEQWQETHRRLWKQGRPHSGKPRFGYIYSRDAGYQLDPDTAPLVREMYRRYLAGDGNRAIADWLTGLGVDALTTGRGVAYFMRSGFAAGYLEHHDPACSLTHKSGTRCANTIREVGAQTAIIDAVTWAAFEATQSDRATLPARLVSPVSTLSGILRCKACGYRMSRKTAHDQRPYFRCTNDQCPHPVSYLEHKAEQLLLDWLPTVGAELAYAARDVAGPTSITVERERLARVVTAAEQSLEKLTVDYARDIIPESSYTAAKDALVRERDQAATKHVRMATSHALRANGGRLAAGLLDNWADLNPEQRNRLTRELCVIEVRRGEKRPEAIVRGLWDIPASS